MGFGFIDIYEFICCAVRHLLGGYVIFGPTHECANVKVEHIIVVPGPDFIVIRSLRIKIRVWKRG